MIKTMQQISILCEKKDRKGLIDLLNMSDIITQLMPGKTEEEIADGFIKAHQTIRNNRDKSEFSQLNKMHDSMQKGNNNNE
tara:strand:+ start:10294 stop:10536 length:243 start_codon:yes stop_codon:yes gene_type:complete